MGKILMPGGGGWYDLDVITVNAADIRKGKVTVDKDGDPVVGAMAENQSPTAALNCGQSKVIPEGYNPGGIVTANSLASQTVGNLAANKIIKGYYGWSNGKKVEGDITISSVVSFSVAAYSTSQVLATWKNPAKGPYSGVAICAKTGGYPANINDGRVYTGVGSNSALNAASTAIVGGLAAGTTYYFRIWVYCTVSSGDMYSGYLQASAKTTAHGRQAFTASGTFTVPADVRSIDIHCTGGGGHGGPTPPYYGDMHGGGGGGGYTSYRNGISVTPGQQVQVTVGAGGDGYENGSILGGKGNNGGSSSATVNGITVTASGGGGGAGAERHNSGGFGGSGGGGGGSKSGNGGADGSSGGDAVSQNDRFTQSNGGTGQGANTREFGSGTGTLYSGGGGGGGGAEYFSHRSVGGAGGGGNGGYYTSYSGPDGHATAGSPGTGGGGGGAYSRSPSEDSAEHDQRGRAAAGGSGNVIIRW